MAGKIFWENQFSQMREGKEPALTIDQEQERDKPQLQLQEASTPAKQDLSPVMPQEADQGVGVTDVAKAAASGGVGWAESTSEILTEPQFRKTVSATVPGMILSLADYAPVIRDRITEARRGGQEALGQAKKSIRESMSEPAKKAIEAELINDNLEFTDDAAKLSTWIMKGTETIARMIPDLVGGGLVGKGLYNSAYETAYKAGISKGLTEQGAKVAANKIASAAVYVPTAFMATTSATGGAGVQAREAIESLPWAELQKSEIFVNNFKAVDADPANESMNDQQKLNLARTLTAEHASTKIMQDPALLTVNALASFIGDATLGRMIAGKMGGGIINKAVTGFAAEAPTEAAQSAAEQYAQNLILIDVAGQDVDPMKGVARAAAEGGLLGGALGGTVGGTVGTVEKVSGKEQAPLATEPAPETQAAPTVAERRAALEEKLAAQQEQARQEKVLAGTGEVQEALAKGETAPTPIELIAQAKEQAKIQKDEFAEGRAAPTVAERRANLERRLAQQSAEYAKQQTEAGKGPVQERLSMPTSPTVDELLIKAPTEAGPSPFELEYRKQAERDYIEKVKDAAIPAGLKGKPNAVKLLNKGYRNAITDFGGLSEQLSKSTAPEPKTDTMAEVIGKMGGIGRTTAEAEGFDPAMFKGSKTFSASGKMTFDDAAEKLNELGYRNRQGDTLDSNDVVDMLYGEVNNTESHYSTQVDPKMLTADAQMVRSWAKALGGADKLNSTIKRSLAGERLGKRQAEVMEDMLDSVAAMRSEGAGQAKQTLDTRRAEREAKRIESFNTLMADATGNKSHIADIESYNKMLSEKPEYYSEEQVILDELVATAGDIDFNATSEAIDLYESGKTSLPNLLTKLSDISNKRERSYAEAKPAIQAVSKPTAQPVERVATERATESEGAPAEAAGESEVTTKNKQASEDQIEKLKAIGNDFFRGLDNVNKSAARKALNGFVVLKVDAEKAIKQHEDYLRSRETEAEKSDRERFEKADALYGDMSRQELNKNLASLKNNIYTDSEVSDGRRSTKKAVINEAARIRSEQAMLLERYIKEKYGDEIAKPESINGKPVEAVTAPMPEAVKELPAVEVPKQNKKSSKEKISINEAKEMGFDTDRILYHGTPSEIDEFDVSKTKDGIHLFSFKGEDVDFYATGSEGKVIPVYVKYDNPLVIDENSSDEYGISMPEEKENLVDSLDMTDGDLYARASEDGNDAIVFNSEDGEQLVVILKSENIIKVSDVLNPKSKGVAPTEFKNKSHSDWDSLSKKAIEGDLTPSEYVAGAEQLSADKERLMSEISKAYTKPKLLEKLGPMSAARAKSEKKDVAVSYYYQQLLSRFHIAETLSYGMGKNAYENAVIESAKKITPESIEAYKEDLAKKRGEYKAKFEGMVKSVKNPETLDEFKQFVNLKGEDKLTTEQKVRYEALLTEAGLSKRVENKMAKAVKKGLGADVEVVETSIGTHGKTGEPIINVKLGRLGADQFKQAAAQARSMGGGYWRGNFYLPDQKSADEFTLWIKGDDIDRTEQLTKGEELKQKVKVTKLISMAEKLEQKANEDLSSTRRENTARQMRMADSSRAKADSDASFAKMLRAVANGIESGEIKYLAELSSKAQLETLDKKMNGLRYNVPQSKIDELMDRDRNSNLSWKSSVSIEDRVQFSRFPMIDSHYSAIERWSSEMDNMSGYKQAAASLKKTIAGLGQRDYATLDPSKPYFNKLLDFLKDQPNYYNGTELAAEYLRLTRMGIDTPAALRTALIELNSIKSSIDAPKKKTTVEVMERKLKRKMRLNRNAFNDFFPTPKTISDDVVSLAGIGEGMKVLEPSAGNGELADAMNKFGADIDVVEMAGDLRAILQEKGYNLVGDDFMEFKSGPVYDRIVMNPPFSNDQDIDHVYHAYDMLKPGGKLVAIVSSMAGDRSNNKNKAFKEWVSSLDGQEELLPENAFLESLNPTAVRTKTIVVEKPEEIKFSQEKDARQLSKNIKDQFDGLKLSMTERGDVVTVENITLPEQRRELGAGSKIMNMITSWADAAGKTLALTPTSDFGGSKSRLVKFYKRFGFVENKGKNKNFEVSESMIREPKESVKFSSDSIVTGTPKGMPAKQVDVIAKSFIKEYKGAAGIKAMVFQTQKEAMDYAGIQDDESVLRHAFYNPRTNEVVLISNNIDSSADARKILRHEVLAHHGLMRVVGQDEWRNVVNLVSASRNAKSLESIWSDIDERYEGFDENTKAEEVIASIAELEPSKLGEWGNRIIAAITRALRKVGFVGDKITATEIKDMIRIIGERIKTVSAGRSEIKNDIKFSNQLTAKDGFSIPDETRKDAFLRSIQDKYRRLKVTQKAVKEQGGMIDESKDVYLAEELFHGKVGEDLRVMEDQYIKPLVEYMGKENVSREELDLYLIARHAPERNAQIAKINPDIQDGGSGMTDAEAAKIMDNFTKEGTMTKVKAAAAFVDGIINSTKQRLIDSGLESQDIVDSWDSAYKHYVPLKGFAVNESDTEGNRVKATGKGFSVHGRETMRAMGRRTVSESPLAYVISDATQSAIRARKNEVAQTMLRLVDANPDPELWQVFSSENPDTTRKITKRKDPATGKTVETVIETVMPMHAMKDKYLGAKMGGEQYYIKLHDPRLMEAMANLGVEQANILTKTIGRVTRVLSALITSYNPEFALSNFARDVQTAVYNVLAESKIEGGKALGTKDLAKEMIKDIPSSMKALKRGFRDNNFTGEWGTYLKEYLDAGAKTGWFVQKDIEEIKNDITRSISTTGEGAANKLIRSKDKVIKFIDDYNDVVENASRLSVYVNARRQGLTEKAAASLAKNLTVNFNRRGEMTNSINALYMFFNASVQGTANMLRAVMTPADKTKKIWDPEFYNLTQKIAMALPIATILMAQANREWGGDDDDGKPFYDKVPDYVKETNFVLMIPGSEGDFIKIPMPYGYNFFASIGNAIDRSMNTESTAIESAFDVVAAFAGAFSPLGAVGSEQMTSQVVKTAAPAVLKPFVEMALNENFTGSPIYKEQNPFGLKTPDAYNSQRRTWEWAKGLSEYLNDLTGGNQFKSGVVDIAPESWQHLIKFAGGGLGSLFGRSQDLAVKTAKGESVESREIPFWRKYMGSISESVDISEMYKRFDEIKTVEKQATMLPGEERIKFINDNRPKVKLISMTKGIQKELTRLNKQKAAIDASKLSDEQKQTRIDAIEERKRLMAARFNKAYNEAVSVK